jgi:N-hydroxyarylamine O-acetyltransferase
VTAPFQRYLRLLGIEEFPRGLSGLQLLVRRHLAVVPFENISKLLLFDREGAPRPFGLDEYLDHIEFSDLGGTCYTLNGYFVELLRALGYDAELLGADMSRPDVHACARVRVESVPYHVDVGFASPFRSPLPLNHLPAEIREGSQRYILDESANGTFRLSQYSGADFVMDYLMHDPPRQRDFFDAPLRESYASTAYFMQCLRINRTFEACSVDLTNRNLTRHIAGQTSVTSLRDLREIKAAVRDELQMPRCPVDQAVAALERRTGKPFFE